MLKRFKYGKYGEDLIAYALLLAFICLASAALLIGATRSA
jgi:hypothetical protein